jgi:hypothetical protein
MMRTRVIVWVFLFAVNFTLGSCNLHLGEMGEAEMNKLSLTLSLSKSTYQLGEDIHASIRLKNIGSEDVVVNKRMALNFFAAPEELRDITFIITGATGETIPFSARVYVRPITPNDFIVLAPGESIDSSYNIGKMYDLKKSGSFIIYAVYQNVINTGNNAKAWKGELTSNSERLEIIP